MTHFGFSEATISGVCLEAAITVRFPASMREARSRVTSWTETNCITGWLSDHVAISGFCTAPADGFSHGAFGVPITSAGRAGAAAGAHGSKMVAAMLGARRYLAGAATATST